MSNIQLNKYVTLEIIPYGIRIIERINYRSEISIHPLCAHQLYFPPKVKILGAKNSFVTLLLALLFHKFNYAKNTRNWGKFINCVMGLPKYEI